MKNAVEVSITILANVDIYMASLFGGDVGFETGVSQRKWDFLRDLECKPDSALHGALLLS